MKRKFVQIAALCVALALLTVSSASAAPPWAWPKEEEETIIRVGLAYGTGVMEGANLMNEVGSGYRFGYYDSDNRFVELGYTDVRRISMVETVNVGYNSAVEYTNYRVSYASTSRVVVGCYHVQLSGFYDSFEEAQAEADWYEDGFVAYIGGEFCVRVGNYPSRSGAEAMQARLTEHGERVSIVGTSEYGVSVVETGTNNILFQYDDMGYGTGLGVKPNAFDGGEGYETWFYGYCYYGGFRYERIKGGALTVVNMVDIDDYAKGVLPYEMSNSWPIEALKAQAVAAKSYALSETRHGAYHFDVCTGTDCQVYQGLNGAGSNTDAAVEAVSGIFALYDGKIANTFFYASNGGASIDISAAWESDQSKYPYLVGVVDPYEADVAGKISGYVSTFTYTGADLAARLRNNGYQPSGSIIMVTVSSRTNSGLPKQVTFTDSAGKRFTVNTKYVVTKIFGGLRSYNYSFEGDTSGGIYTNPQPSGGGFTINGQSAVDSTDGLYAIDGDGNYIPLDGNAYVITGDGIYQEGTVDGAARGFSMDGAEDYSASGGATGRNGVFTVITRGRGHNIGMSQWGAYAMALRGYTYDEILEFYYTGITVGYY